MTRSDPRRGGRRARPLRGGGPGVDATRADRVRTDRLRAEGADGARADRARHGGTRARRVRRAEGAPLERADAGRTRTRRPRPAARYRRRRLAAAALAGLVLLVGLGLTGRLLLYDTGLADVEGVEVGGALVVPVPDVLAAAAVAPGVPLASVDTAAVAARVERLPGVGRAEVSRDWPHTVRVEVFERTPVAVAETPAGPVLVDGSGVPYAPAATGAALPVLAFGPVDPGDPATRAALDVLAALPEPVRADVRRIEAGADGNLTLELTGDREVRWGDAEPAAEKAAVLVPLLTRDGRVYDVTSPNLPTIRR